MNRFPDATGELIRFPRSGLRTSDRIGGCANPTPVVATHPLGSPLPFFITWNATSGGPTYPNNGQTSTSIGWELIVPAGSSSPSGGSIESVSSGGHTTPFSGGFNARMFVTYTQSAFVPAIIDVPPNTQLLLTIQTDSTFVIATYDLSSIAQGTSHYDFTVPAFFGDHLHMLISSNMNGFGAFSSDWTRLFYIQVCPFL